MAKRRKGTIPQRVMLTQRTVDRIDAYQPQHQIRSFSAAAETLLRIGLDESPAEILGPIIVSTLRHTLYQELERLIRLQLYTAVDAGMAQRFAAQAVRDVGRLKGDPPERYQQLKAAVRADTRRRLTRDRIGAVIDDLYGALVGSAEQTPPQAPEEEHGDRASGLPDAQPGDE